MKPEIVKPVKYFVGTLFSSETLLEEAVKLLTRRFDVIDQKSQSFAFENTDYYNAEMGVPIFRKFYSFAELRTPDYLTQAKLITNQIENSLTVDARRKVNLDVGYMDYDKIVLASAKYGINKIYLSSGIYADMALHYEKGNYFPYPWAFADFKYSQYYPFFLEMRIKYKRQLKIQPV